jgi:hypothetical protein
MILEMSKPVPVFDYSSGGGGILMPNGAPVGSKQTWAASIPGGGGPISGIVTFSTIRPDGKTAHGGVWNGEETVYHLR